MAKTVPAAPASSSRPYRVLSYDVGTKNMGICLLVHDPTPGRWLPFKIEQWERLDLQCNNIIKRGVYAFCEKMEDRPWSQSADRVVIESQHKNPRMKHLAHGMLAYHYITAKYKRPSFPPHKYVDFMSAASKLTVHPRLFADSKEPTLKYQQRKNLAKKHARAILVRATETGELETRWLTWFDKLGAKSDDAADAFLQGAHVLLRYNDKRRPRKRKRRTRKRTQSNNTLDACWSKQCLID